MPTFDKLARFLREYQALTPAERTAYLQAVTDFVEDLRRGNFRASLHVHALPGFPNIFSILRFNQKETRHQTLVPWRTEE